MLKSQSKITSESFNLSDSHIKIEPLEKGENYNIYFVKIKIKELYNKKIYNVIYFEQLKDITNPNWFRYQFIVYIQ